MQNLQSNTGQDVGKCSNVVNGMIFAHCSFKVVSKQECTCLVDKMIILQIPRYFKWVSIRHH